MTNDIKQLTEAYTNSVLKESTDFPRGSKVDYKSHDGKTTGRGTVQYTIRDANGPQEDNKEWRVVKLQDGTSVNAMVSELTLISGK